MFDFPEFRRQFIAYGATATMAVIVVVLSIAGRPAATREIDAEPIPLGRIEGDPRPEPPGDTPDQEPVDTEPSPPTEPEKPAAETQPAADATESTAPNEETPESSETDEPAEPQPDSADPPDEKEKEPLRPDDTPPPKIPDQEKTVEEMSEQELQEAVDKYESWVQEGQIELKLDDSQVPPSLLHRIIAYYVLDAGTSNRLLLDRSTGQVQQNGPPGRKLQVALDETAWTPEIKMAADRFGQGAPVRVHYLLSDACACRIYQALAQHMYRTEGKQAQPGSAFLLKLHPGPPLSVAVHSISVTTGAEN